MKNKGIARYLLSVFIAVVFVCCLHSSGLALNDEEVTSKFQFNFITPGARATAMGGAFIGLADDATAAESNPAGLTQLLKPEISAEFKYITYTTEQVLENFYRQTDIRWKEFDDSVTSVPFVSVVYPYNRFVFSVYRQELVNYKISLRTGAYSIRVTGDYYHAYFDWPIDASMDLTVTNYGFGVAVQLLEGFSLAVSPRGSEMKMKSHSARFKSNPTDFSDEDAVYDSRINDDDSGFSMNIGLMWDPHPQVSIGAVYRNGPKFTVTDDEWMGSDTDLAEFTLKVPDSFGVGVAFRVTDILTCTIDVIHIQYEDLLEDFDIWGSLLLTKDDYTIDNATEIHVGVEYILLDKRSLALRAGIYHESDNTIRFTGTAGYADHDASERWRFPGGDDQIHVTGGLGLVLNDHFQIDTAADIAENNKQFSVSAVYRF